jgi:large subunit ribosomal protein L29
MNGKEVRAMKDDELKLELAKQRNAGYDNRTKRVTETVEDTSAAGKVRKDIARLLTEQRARHLKAHPKAPRAAAPAPAKKAARTPKAKTTTKPAAKAASK